MNYFRWLLHYPRWPLIWFTGLSAFSALAWFVHWGYWIPAGLLLFINGFYWKSIGEHFRFGDANPGIVVLPDPMLIAVWTDMSKGFGKYPAIRIFKKRMSRLTGQPVQRHSRLATVAVYRGWTSLPHWDDFDPRPVDCATGDLTQIQRLMDTFTDEDWKRLEDGLKLVPKPYRPGLFFLNKDVEESAKKHPTE